jgi:hypothetical protein
MAGQIFSMDGSPSFQDPCRGQPRDTPQKNLILKR